MIDRSILNKIHEIARLHEAQEELSRLSSLQSHPDNNPDEVALKLSKLNLLASRELDKVLNRKLTELSDTIIQWHTLDQSQQSIELSQS